MPPNKIIHVGDGFWNVRGSFKIGGVLDIGTHASLVRRRSGKYVLLDACSIDAATRTWIDEETGGGEAIEAVLHLHPFHTVFARSLHEIYPKAKLYGTARHHQLAQDLPWQSETTDAASVHEQFAEDLDFSVPRGVDFISANEKLHFSSVLAFHRGSSTLHVDDTLCYVRMPPLVRLWKADALTFHPSLAKVLEPRAGAAEAFRGWTRELFERSRTIENLCAAHTSVLRRDNDGASIATRIEAAIQAVEPKLAAHEQRYG